MKALLLATIIVVGGAIVVTPAASACPDPDNPCTPMPWDPLDPPNIFCDFPALDYGSIKRFAVCVLP